MAGSKSSFFFLLLLLLYFLLLHAVSLVLITQMEGSMIPVCPNFIIMLFGQGQCQMDYLFKSVCLMFVYVCFLLYLCLDWCRFDLSMVLHIRRALKCVFTYYRCEQVLFVHFYNNPAPVNGSMQFHYCTVSNPRTGANDAFVLKRCV